MPPYVSLRWSAYGGDVTIKSTESAASLASWSLLSPRYMSVRISIFILCPCVTHAGSDLFVPVAALSAVVQNCRNRCGNILVDRLLKNRQVQTKRKYYKTFHNHTTPPPNTTRPPA